jgi:hypothetical protein
MKLFNQHIENQTIGDCFMDKAFRMGFDNRL